MIWEDIWNHDITSDLDIPLKQLHSFKSVLPISVVHIVMIVGMRVQWWRHQMETFTE